MTTPSSTLMPTQILELAVSTFFLKFINKVTWPPYHIQQWSPYRTHLWICGLSPETSCTETSILHQRYDPLSSPTPKAGTATRQLYPRHAWCFPPLYTKHSHREGIKACRHFLNTRPTQNSQHKSLPTERICDLIHIILGMNNFTFNHQHLLQIHSTAMGTRMAPSYANLFMGKLEQHAIENAPFKPFVWWRFIDVIFMVWTKGEDKSQNLLKTTWKLYPSNNQVHRRVFKFF